MVMLRGTKIWDYHAAVCRGQAKLSEILKAFSTSKQQEKEDKLFLKILRKKSYSTWNQ